MDSVLIIVEFIEFSLMGDFYCWWILGDWDIYEYIYNEICFSEIDVFSKCDYFNLV